MAPRAGFLGVGGDRVFEVAEHDVDLRASLGDLGADLLVMCGGTKWIMRSSLTGSSRSGCGAPMASGLLMNVSRSASSGLKNWRGGRPAVERIAGVGRAG
jgi:hypothetical protein